MALLDRKHVPWLPRDPLSILPAELMYDIIRRSSVETLGRLAQVSKLFYEFVTPALYEKDADDEKPRAIIWAASADTTQATEKIITKVLDLAKEYGGDVNGTCMYNYGGDQSYKVTPLHIAAARRNIAAARKLLELGAEVNALGRVSFRPWSARSQDKPPFLSELADSAIRHAASHGLWRPLFAPFVVQHEEMIQLLLQFGASPVLSVPIDDPWATENDLGTINILHILSAKPGAKTTDDANQSYFEKFAALIDVPLQQGSTPLSLALRQCNGKALKMLMANGAHVEVLNEFGRTLLTQAIAFRLTSKDAQVRQWYKNIAEYLIKSGQAKVGNYGPQQAWETPLTCAIKAIPQSAEEQRWRTIQDAGAIINLLLEHGADVNERSGEGITVIHALCDIICGGNNSNGLLEIFDQLVQKGADLAIPFPCGRSVLGTCIMMLNQRRTKFCKRLLELHAPLVPREADIVFVKWSKSPGFRKLFSAYASQFRNHISQSVIDSVYEGVLGRDEALFKQLREHFPRTTIAERFASEILLDGGSHSKWFYLALDMEGFDGSYIDKDGNGLLHCIIYRLENNPKYKDDQARDDASELLWRGAVPNHKNSLGQTPLQALKKFVTKRDCPVLKLYLYEVKALWDELMEEHGPEGINQPSVKKQWREALNRLLPQD